MDFITDHHQICVGITRAKHGLVIVGECNSSVICHNILVKPYFHGIMSEQKIKEHYCTAVVHVNLNYQ